MKKFLNWIKSPSSDFALFLIVLVLANIVGHNAYKRFDFTSTKSFSLSKSSKQIVRNLEEPLSVKVFFDDNLPAMYEGSAQYVKDLLSEYEGAAKRNFSVSYMDMSREENKDLASSYGLRQIQIQEVKATEVGFKAVYMGLVLTYGDCVELMDGLVSADGFEYKFTSTVSKMISKVDALSGLAKGNKIDVTLYISPVLKSLGIAGVDKVEQYVKDAFENVNTQNMDRLSFSVIKPAVSEVENICDTYGLPAIQYGTGNNNMEKAVLGIVISYNDIFRSVSLPIERGFFGYQVSGLDNMEDTINVGIQSLLSKSTKVGFVVGHNEHSLTNPQDAANFNELVSQNYELVQLDLYAEDVPAGINTIIIDGPRYDYSEEELYRIDQFLMKGGNVLFFLDPMIEMGGGQYGGGQGTYRPLNLNVDQLLEGYGVTTEKAMVMDDECFEALNQDVGQKLKYYWIPKIDRKNLNSKSPVTSNLGYGVMFQNGPIDASVAKASKDLDVTVLVKSSDRAWTEKEDLYFNPLLLAPPAETHSYDLAVIVEGKFQSAFAEPPVRHRITEDGIEEIVDTSKDEYQTIYHIPESRQKGKIFVVGSSQITSYAVLYDTSSTPMSMFIMNVLDYMNGNEELCVMRTKGSNTSSLNVKYLVQAQIVKYFNIVGLVILVALTGLLVWRGRNKRRTAIRKRYNPNDVRTITKHSGKIENQEEKE